MFAVCVYFAFCEEYLAFFTMLITVKPTSCIASLIDFKPSLILAHLFSIIFKNSPPGRFWTGAAAATP